MPTAPVDDTFLHYEEVGQGPRALVLHGGLGIDHHVYRPGLDGLGRALRLVYYDHRCHGASGDAPLESLTLQRLADDADELRRHLGDDKVGVIGHSFGGFIAYELAARHPETIRFLIILCSSPALDFGDEIAASMEARMTAEMRAALDLPDPERTIKALQPLYFHRWDPAYGEALDASVRTNHAAALAAGRHLQQSRWTRWADLPAFEFPVLLVMGRHDFIPHLDRADRAAELLPDATVKVFEHSGHYPWLEEPEAFVRVVTAWVRSRSVISDPPIGRA